MEFKRKDLIRKVQKDFPQLKNEVVKVAVDVFFNEIIRGLGEHRPILLTRFGLFRVLKRKTSRPNMAQFKDMEIKPITYYPHFKFSTILKRKANDNL
jgi:nucleoid DNA-binding protein